MKYYKRITASLNKEKHIIIIITKSINILLIKCFFHIIKEVYNF